MADEMSQFKIEDAEGNITTYEIVDAKARADIQSLELNGSGGSTSTGFFAMEVDEQGNLYAIYDDGTRPPSFEFSEDGNLYYILEG